ncbi:MAG: substrate-binding periplasmic protein [Psychrobium sp.]
MNNAYSNITLKALVFIGCSLFINVSHAKQQLVTIVADDSYPPYSYLEDGQVKGIYVDLISLAAQRLAKDYQVNFVAMPWKRALQEVKLGKAFAIIPPYIHTHKRDYIWPYSAALAYERVVAHCHDSVDIRSHLVGNDDARDTPLNVGINAGYLILNERLSQAQGQGLIRIWENRSTKANVMKLINQRIDCYLNDPLSTKWVLKQLSAQDDSVNFNHIHQTIEVMVQSAHIGYSSDEHGRFKYKKDFVKRFDKALAAVKRENALEKIIAKYVP